MSRRMMGWLLVALASLGLAQVSVEDRWRYTPPAQKDAVTAERLVRYTFAADGQRLCFEVRVDGRVASRFVKRFHGRMLFIVRLEPKPLRSGGLVISQSVALLPEKRRYGVLARTTERRATGTVTQTYVSKSEEAPTVLTRTRVRQRDRIVTETQVSSREPGTRVEVALELPFAGVRAPATLTPSLAIFGELEAGHRYELLSGRWGEGHTLAVYVTPLAD